MSTPDVIPMPEPVGRCRVCGCTAADPCRLPNGDECMWVNRMGTLCNNERCLRAAARQARTEKRQRREQVRELVHPVIEGLRKQREERRRKRRPRGFAA